MTYNKNVGILLIKRLASLDLLLIRELKQEVSSYDLQTIR
jgi:hypothetical protein